MLFVLTAAALLLFGWGVALWTEQEHDPPHPLERAAAAITIAFGVWLAIDWALALTHTLMRPALYLRTFVIGAAGLFLVARRWRPIQWRIEPAWCWFLIPTASWTGFVVWRATITPPLSHDALSNHLPRAVLYARMHGFSDLTQLSRAFKDMPANYELLLADMIVMLRHDQYTEWLSTLLYLAFVVMGGALASRWWRHQWTTILTMTLLACMPVTLLHAGADKNDLLVGTFMVAALVWAGRYWTNGELRSLLLLGTSLFIAVGTKNQAAGLGATLLPLVLWRMTRDLRSGRLRIRAALGAVAFGFAGFVLLGGYTYFDQYLRSAPPAGSRAALVGKQTPVTAYGDWRNLWQGPYLMIAAPFSIEADRLRVPWDPNPWFYRRYEIYFAHFGIPFALCMIGVPFAFAAWRDGPARNERRIILLAAVLALLVQLPAYLRPHGAYIISLGRYAMFMAAQVFAWTLGSLLTKAPSRRAPLIAAGAAAFFLWYGVDYAVRDSFAPLEFALVARHYPGTRYIPFDPHRATSRVDALAGPLDVIALDVAWASWIHPVFGRHLSRPVYFIPPGPGPVQLPKATKWVVVERAYAVIWGSSAMSSLGDARKHFHQNKPGEAELRVVRALLRDPRYELVWLDRTRNQAIFKRVRP